MHSQEHQVGFLSEVKVGDIVSGTGIATVIDQKTQAVIDPKSKTPVTPLNGEQQ